MNSKILRSVGDEIVVVEQNLGNEVMIFARYSQFRAELKAILRKHCVVPSLLAYELSLLTNDNELINAKFERAAGSIGTFSRSLLRAWIDEQPTRHFQPKTESILSSFAFSKTQRVDQTSSSPFTKYGFTSEILRYFASGTTLETLGLFSAAAIVNPTLRALRRITEFYKNSIKQDIVLLTAADLAGEEWVHLDPYWRRAAAAGAEIVMVTTEEDFRETTELAKELGLMKPFPESQDTLILILSHYQELSKLCRGYVSAQEMTDSGILFQLAEIAR